MSVIQDALAPVLRDVAATTDVDLQIEVGGWSTELGPSALIQAGRGATGVYVRLADSESERVIAATEAVQEVVIEELWARASNWPMCPAHRSSHPMDARSVSEQAWWVCPADGALVALVGTLKL
jgi:hypothetical protein